MEFMQKEKADRALEREQDKKELQEMISMGVKKEVEISIQPIKEKQAGIESEQETIKKQFSEVLEEVKEIKTQLQSFSLNSGSFPSLPKPKALLKEFDAVQDKAPQVQGGHGEEGHSEDLQEKLRLVISTARRTVGLHRIDSGDLVRMRQVQYGGAKTETEERFLAVNEFLKYELKLSSEAIDAMEIENIYAPDRRDSECLYVTFKHGSSIGRIYERTRCMRKAARILNYIPAEFQERYYDIRDMEYNLRQEENCQTRVKMGLKDLELSKKIRDTGSWVRVPLPPGLAAVDLTRSGAVARPSLAAAESPAPGRPDQDRSGKRLRESPGNQAGQSNPKAPRGGSPYTKKLSEEHRVVEREVAWEEAIESAD